MLAGSQLRVTLNTTAAQQDIRILTASGKREDQPSPTPLVSSQTTTPRTNAATASLARTSLYATAPHFRTMHKSDHSDSEMEGDHSARYQESGSRID